MSVYYKFNSELNYSYVDFDGLHIAVSDLKKAILHQKRLGKTADFDLLISNAQTKEEYKEEQCLIPKNTSLIVARIPLSNQNKKSWEIAAQNAVERAPQNPSAETINHDITRMNGTEDDKIQAMMMQSTLDYDPTNYQRVRGNPQMGDVPANYRCHKCNKPGHWIKNCPLNPLGKEGHHHFKSRPESKKMTGIPRSLRDAIAENQEPVQSHLIEEKREIPEDLICAICKGIFKDAVMIPCCGSSFCDECVRTALLESEDNECPDCKEKGTSPGSLIPNRFLRNAVTSFHAETSNVLNRDSQRNVPEEVAAPEEVDEEAAAEEAAFEEIPQDPAEILVPVFHDEEEVPELEAEEVNKLSQADKDSSSDDDNITVTVPPAHQQSRGASFRDSRLRRIPSQSVGEFSDSHAHSSSKNHHDDGESYEDESGDSYHRHRSSSSKRGNHYESSQPQGIATLGDDKGSSRDHYRDHSSRPTQNMPHEESYQSHLQHPQHYNQGQHSGMMTQMPQHAMYQQGPFIQQPPGQYYPPNQIRRYDHQGNYQVAIRHPNAPNQMMRPAMHEGYGMRHPRPPMNNLANAVTQNIQQRYGTGFIDDPLEAFNRIMREKELRKDRYRRSPIHNNERRSRSFERKRSPMHQYSPDNRRQKNYTKTRKRSRSFKSNSKSYSRSRSRDRSMRGRSKSRTYSPRYRRKENVQSKDRRDDRHRSPARRGTNYTNRNSRGNFKGDSAAKPSFRDTQENLHYHENASNQLEKVDEYPKDPNNAFEAPHSLDEQPPPPGDESETILPTSKQRKDSEKQEKEIGADEDVQNKSAELNGSTKVESDSRKDERYHHHKKSRTKNYETSSDDKKVRDKKKRKKSREHDKKKSKKDRKSRPDKEKDKKSSSKAESSEQTPEAAASSEVSEKIETSTEEKSFHREPSKEAERSTEVDDRHHTPEIEDDKVKDSPVKSSGEKQNFRRSDSILDINPNVDLELDEWAAPEVSKWERDDNKSLLDTSEGELGNGDLKKNPEERVTFEIIKRAENALFSRAISAIRPIENKKSSKTELDVSGPKKENSPVLKRSDSSKDSKLQAFQVSVPANESGTRSVDLKPSESTRDASKQRKSPLRTSIKNRLGVKIVEKKSRSPSRSPKRRLQSDCTKVSRSSRDRDRDRGGRSQIVSSRDRHQSPDRRNKPLSSLIRVEPRDTRGNSRTRKTDRRRSRTPDERRPIKRQRISRSRSKSRHELRRNDQRSHAEKSYAKPKEPQARSDEKSSRPAEQPALSDLEKSKAKGAELPIRKKSRDPSSSSSASSNSGSQKHSKRHSKHKVKKRSRSPSADSNSKRKKSKKEKKAKKKKKSRK